MDDHLDEDEIYREMFDVEGEALGSGTGVVDDPYPIWRRLLSEAPVHEGSLAECMGLSGQTGAMHLPGFRYYTAFGFDAASEVFTRKDDFNSSFYMDLGVHTHQGYNILMMDGPTHYEYRRLIQGYFQPEAASTWWHDKIIAKLVDDLIRRFEGAETVDLNAQLCARLPMHTVTAAFGLSPREGIEFRRNTHVAMNHHTLRDAKAAAVAAAEGILGAVVRERRKDPRDDLISALANAQLEDDGHTRLLTVEEVVAFCQLIMFAGGGTTWKQLGITLFALLNNREQLEAVRADRSLVHKAILESARWYPNDPVFPRKATRDTVLQGVSIPKDSVVMLCLGSANRDPSRWEEPDTYDLFRPVKRSLAFAAGHHSCLGQHVARQEMAVALNALLDRFPNLRWDPSHKAPALSGSLVSRGAGPLHVLLQ